MTIHVHLLVSIPMSCVGRSRLVEVACDRSSLLAACVAEAVRLQAPGVAVRMAACDLDVPAGQDTTVHIKKVVVSVLVLGVCPSPFPFPCNAFMQEGFALPCVAVAAPYHGRLA